MTDGFIHIAKSEFTPQEHEADCKSKTKEPQVGYGLAGGGFGAYGYCRECGAILWKTEDNGE